jgi:tetratricopeptide (TPR) repeat protein
MAPLLKTTEADMLSRTALGMRNMALCDYYMAIGQPDKAIKISHIYLELRKNAGSSDKTEMQTLSEYAMHLNLCIRSGIYDGFEENLAHYKTFVDAIRNKDKFAVAYERWYLYAFIYLLHSGRFNEALTMLEKEKKKILEFDKVITKKSKISIWYFTAYLHYAQQDYKAALKLIQKIMNEANDEVEEYFFSKLLLMFIHYDLKNFELLEYQVRSAQRLMEKKDQLYLCEKLAMDFFKTVNAVDSQKLRHQQLEELQNKVDSLFRTPYEKGFSFYFDIQSWIEGQLKRTAFAEIVKQKSS